MNKDNKPPKEELASVIQCRFDPDLPGRRPVPVTLQRSETRATADQGLWIAIRNRTQAISFDRFSRFVDLVLFGADNDAAKSDPAHAALKAELTALPRLLSVDAYNLLRIATEAFLLLEAGLVVRGKDGTPIADSALLDPLEESERLGQSVTLDEIKGRLQQYFGDKATLPYLNRIMLALTGIEPEIQAGAGLTRFERVLQGRLSSPSMIELIWSYWHEEGMLVQSMNAIALRFQNRRAPGSRDPLATLELDSLRPLNNILWGYIQNTYTRLTVPRRAYEYDHHYGLTILGKAVPMIRSADSRSKFLEAFHNVLYRASIFYREDADTTVVADAFPLLNAIRELHIILAEGAHNQFGDLPWTARVEMMIEQWLLARTEMKEFLRGRAAVPYQEPWIGVVDTMRRLQGWGDSNTTHFHELAVTGEQLLLTIRYNDWVDINFTQEQAKNWARYWKNELQRYMHAYQAVTGVDLTADITDSRALADRYLQPSSHLRNRLGAQRNTPELAAPDRESYSPLPSPARRVLRSGGDD